MFVTPIEHAVQKRKKQKQRSVVDPVTRERQLKRNLADLEKDNFSDIRFEIPKDLLQRRVLPISVRRILSSRKTFVNYLDETPNSRYNTCVAKPSYKPPRKFCNVCGYWGKYACQNCGTSYCSKGCEVIHSETRCMKVYA
ncbi:Swr1 complex histone chaperone module subunit Vps71 [Schizosaccharomyces pombe]|uniref:SWR1 complex subunit vps71 n=1 Tax=Schizosaccharomyces pombe (strain 972 / ATCC 24843) TaxID=284812 RepID=VPS71_SCHPO|nr:Swr1 complex subunit Vps71 [Schizosaccharomyces pombe]O59669.2 RecName: Full=SWR1 complex subunit vps71 [Schizosaccharomyces pombe 972h-]CAB60106.1 Swr1 complex subunit Vps71 [Schizosaccharomyces pombe]|eukprot:NP_595833.1 Swr1 complex subunit Vps71 [Schizosaccharomyces pombe]